VPGKSSFTPQIGEFICNDLASGKSLRQICEAPDMPGRRTVLDWLELFPDFRAKYARAREAQADVMDEKILEVAEACTNENAQAARVKIDAYKWRASKLAPKKYGDKIAHVGGDDTDAPVKHDVAVRFVKATP
jgi:hypothetical protein